MYVVSLVLVMVRLMVTIAINANTVTNVMNAQPVWEVSMINDGKAELDVSRGNVATRRNGVATLIGNVSGALT
jgi:hypothetical protein